MAYARNMQAVEPRATQKCPPYGNVATKLS